MRRSRWLLAILAGTATVPAYAQSVSVGVEATTDDRRRGISWSDGKAAIGANAALRLSSGFDIGVRAMTTRDDPRHGGADAAIDLTGGFAREIGGGFRFDAFVTGHLFAGAGGKLDYVEGGLGASYALGPAEVGVDARYAPAQSAIGGDNLWIGARARMGVPMTPLTFTGSVGRSTGSVDDPIRAARLRPGGDYTDWSLGVDHIVGPLTVGAAYTGTDIGRVSPSPYANARHTGDKLTARVAVSF